MNRSRHALSTGRGRLAQVLLGACSIAGTSSPAAAQDDSTTVVTPPPPPAAAPATVPPQPAGGTAPDIVVTAQRRTERLQDVPIAITAVPPARLTQLGLFDLPALQQVTPGLNFTTGINYASTYIRGVGSEFQQPGREPAVATYIDGSYVGRGFGSIFDILDPASVEVLRGPQGTLWGRNATGGAILINSADPEEKLGGRVFGELGNIGHSLIEGELNVPVTDTISTRFAVRYRHDGGFVRNLPDGYEFGRHENWIGRGKVAWRPSSNFKAVAEFQYDHADRSPSANSEFLPSVYCLYCSQSKYALPVQDPYTAVQNVLFGGKGGEDTSRFYNLRMYYTADKFTVTSTSGYRRMHNFEGGDFDYTEIDAFNIGQISGSKSFTQDVVASTTLPGLINATAGASYVHDRSFIQEWFFTGNELPPRAPDVSNVVRTESISGFGEATLRPLRGLEIVGGIRYTHDRRRIFDQHIDFNSWTPRFVASYNTGPANFYVSYNRGFKAGGYSVPASTALVFRPEKIDSYEAGVKYQSRDRRVRANLAAFTYRYHDIQTNAVDQTDPNAISRTQNANGKGRGVEVDFDVVPFPVLHVFGGGAYLDAHYTSFPNAGVQVPTFDALGQPTGIVAGSEDLSGMRFPQAAKWTGFLGATVSHEVAGGWKGELTGFVRYSSSYDFQPGGGGPLRADRQPSFATVRANVRVVSPDGRYEIGVFAENLTDRKYYDFRFTTAPFGGLQYVARPRTYGLRAAGKF